MIATHGSLTRKGEALSQQDPATVAAILSSAVDVTVLMTADGVICDQVYSSADMPKGLFTGWPGKALRETVTIESRNKVEMLLMEAAVGQTSVWRQVNHPFREGHDLPVSYSALRVGPQGHIVAMGRDLSSLAQLQQRLVAAEQAMESEYQRLRNAETRYRMLLQSASDAILIVETRSGKIAELNTLAANLLDKPAKRLQGADVVDAFPEADREGLRTALNSLRANGRADDIALAASDNQQQAHASFSAFRQENTQYFIVRMTTHVVGSSAVVVPKAQSKVVKIISEMPDGFVVTDTNLNVLTANAAFLDLVQLASEEQARGVSIERWVGRQGVDLGVVVSQLRERGEIRNFHTIVRGQYGAVDDVEVSAVAVTEGDTPCFGFSLHHVSRQRNGNNKSDNGLLRSVDEFTRLVGKVPLKELVRESTDIIERLCIEAALQMNGDNRANAAEMLGLSRQSLYMKLHRYGIDDNAVVE
jgi:transcriptional regulator PpsR